MVKPNMSAEGLRKLLVDRFPPTSLVWKALAQSHMSHKYHCRDDGKPYLDQHVYPLTTEIMEYYAQDPDVQEVAVVAALLHDVPEEDPNCPISRIEKEYGTEVANLVDGLQKKKKVSAVRTQQDRHDEQVEYVEKLTAASSMVKVIYAFDKINNALCTEAYRDPEKYTRFVTDTEKFFLPIVRSVDEKLGTRLTLALNAIKDELGTK